MESDVVTNFGLQVRRWDTRNTNDAVLAFKAFAPVRQVSCNPTNPHQFAAALENGVVQIWDMRNDKQCWDKIMAHQVLCCDCAVTVL